MLFFAGPAGQETGHDFFFAARGPGSAQPASRVALDLVFVSARFDPQMAQNTINSQAFHDFRGPSCWPSQAGRPAKRESDLGRWRLGMISFWARAK